MNLPTLQFRKVLESPATITKFRKHIEIDKLCLKFYLSMLSSCTSRKRWRHGHLNVLACREYFSTTKSAVTSMGHGGRCPQLLQMGHGGAVSRTENKKTDQKLHCPSQTRSPTRLIVLLEPKSRGARKKTFFRSLCAGPVPLPHFQIRSGATDHKK